MQTDALCCLQCSALQGLLRKLGAGFDEMMPSGGLSSAQLKVCSHACTPHIHA
jgi:hypothetical protein